MTEPDWNPTGDSEERSLTPELEDVVHQLRGQRPDLSALELDRMKRRAMAQARRGTAGRSAKKGVLVRNKFATLVLSGALVVSGSGVGVLAGKNGKKSKNDNAGDSQYCDQNNGSNKSNKSCPPPPKTCKSKSAKSCPPPTTNKSNKGSNKSNKSDNGKENH